MKNSDGTSLQRSLALVTVAGCLAMVYIPMVGGAMATDYFRRCGFTERHFGILSAIPMITFALQFVGALVSNRLHARKPLFMILVIVGRMMWLPIVLLPLLFPDLSLARSALCILSLLAISAAVSNLSIPIWYTWMADLIPPRILNRYWGGRYTWMWVVQVTISVMLAFYSFFYERLGLSLPQAFRIAVVFGVIAGVMDILLFIWVPEPENAQVRGRCVRDIILEPLSDRGCRSFLVWNCAYMAAVMVGAAFMQLYMLKILAMPLWKVVAIWSSAGIGFAVASRFWGRIADAHGHRPIMTLCSTLKPLSPLMFMLVTPSAALYVLFPFVFFDSLLNAGNAVAKNGFMLKLAPRENRSMFVAVMFSLPSIAGGLAAMCGGEILTALENVRVSFAGREWNNYQMLFGLSFVCRCACMPLAAKIKERGSTRSRQVFVAITSGWPLRLLTYPIGLYRRWGPGGDGDTDADADSGVEDNNPGGAP